MADGAFQNIFAPTYAVKARDPPPEGTMAAPFVITLTAVDFAQSISYSLGAQSMSQVRALQIDNSANGQDLTIYHGAARQRTVVPSNGGGFIPTTSGQGQYFLSTAVLVAPATDIVIGVTMFNYEIPPSLWGTQTVKVTGDFPVGGIIMWTGAGPTVPTGWGLCDGSSYPRADGSGLIASPDMRDRFTIGATGAYAPGTTGGSKKILQANFPLLNLPVTDPGHAHAISLASFAGPNGPGVQLFPLAGNFNTAATATGISVSTGGAGADFLQPYYAVAFIMKL